MTFRLLKETIGIEEDLGGISGDINENFDVTRFGNDHQRRLPGSQPCECLKMTTATLKPPFAPMTLLQTEREAG
ncbi:hypothetical protein C7B82_14625 [Stenomitos frigidus ULC18]|uniref:Uncharacterized protein n=1 Tax=Stenomitos frigidus ULC18 TaxID=2107698 RepID=A0A2T1E5T1_9CYAN|nr:hypothetical protein C7B82_14625 [Stenomitos frigidus ULC18]